MASAQTKNWMLEQKLPVGLASFQGQYTTDRAMLTAASIILMVPLLLVFTFNQRYFLRVSVLGCRTAWKRACGGEGEAPAEPRSPAWDSKPQSTGWQAGQSELVRQSAQFASACFQFGRLAIRW